jgi:hypothetical protein
MCPNFASISTNGTASVLYTFIFENFCTEVGLKVLFIILTIWENFASLGYDIII